MRFFLISSKAHKLRNNYTLLIHPVYKFFCFRYKCEECPYSSAWKRDLERHVLVHKKRGEVKMFECQFCAFSSKHQRYLAYHVSRIHLNKELLSTGTYSCANCSYTTKHKRNLVSHVLIHKYVYCESDVYVLEGFN